jgi:RNA polymerase sigma-70 factor (ECF subfamily)
MVRSGYSQSLPGLCIDYLKSQYSKHVHESDLPEYLATSAQADTPLQVQQLADAIRQAVDELPEKCRLIHMLSRTAELSYQEIATQLDLSVKTVEAHMGGALRKLKIGFRATNCSYFGPWPCLNWNKSLA